jgi:hypothetical protein
MKYHIIIKGLSVFTLTFIFTLACTGCSEDPSITSFENNDSVVIGEKKFEVSRSKKFVDQSLSTVLYSGEEPVTDSDYPQSASCVVRYFKNWGYYRGSSCNIPNGSFFEFGHGTLVPPENIPLGDELTITMRCDRDPVSGELIFSFGPSGCQFDPPAKVWLDWSELGSPSAMLYYLKEDGGREEQLPDQIDVNNKHMCIYIDHFSRYALAYSN